ncbi:MAG: hypothetical protein Q9223_001457 [Gallowayella weberi]
MAGDGRSDHDSSMREFKAKVDACTMKAVCDRSYVLVAELAQWLRSNVHPDKPTTQVGRLVTAAYRETDILPLSTDNLMAKDSCCLIIFSILLLLGKGKLIHKFQRHNVLDKHLPIPLQQLQVKLQTAHIPDAERLAADFDEKQWRFCPAKFGLDYGQEYNEHTILPICKKEKINEKGGTAQMWQIEVKEEFVGQKLKKAVSFSRYNCSPSATEPDWRYHFALKSFEEGSVSLYENEKKAFNALRKNNGMVRYLADYTHAERRDTDTEGPGRLFGNQGEQVTRNTFNLLLEFGEFDLDEFFAQRLPPVLQVEIEEFWSSLFDVADALDGTANLKIEENGVVKEFHGWHADIKPDNILSVQGKFKLSDPGFAKFKKKAETDPEEFVFGGTETYGEAYTNPILSGCIAPDVELILRCSRATPRKKGNEDCRLSSNRHLVFRMCILDRRIVGVAQVPSAPKRQKYAESSISSISAGDYFHDGKQVLQDVTTWHKVLRSALRETDNVTSGLLDLVDQKMLLRSASSRIKAKDLCSELKQLVTRSQEGPRTEVPASITDTLLKMDKDAAFTISPSRASNISPPSDAPEDRKARKSRLLEVPLMKTAHRSEGLNLYPTSDHTQPESGRVGGHSTAMSQALKSSANHSIDVSSIHPHQPRRPPPTSTPNVITPPVFPSQDTWKPARKPKTHPPQNVFQARKEIEKRDKHNFLRKEHKDELLKQYFGNRDLKFLVDNGESMRTHWAETEYLLKTLVLKAAGQDDDGLDLSFTLGQEKLANKKSTSKDWERAMEKAQPGTQRSNMKTRLAEIFEGYLRQVQEPKAHHSAKPLRKLTIIVLTDGIWGGMGNNQNAVSETIVNFHHKLQRLHANNLDDRIVSIEFVQLGNDAAATYRLRQLDTGMKWKGIPDIIDTEPASGDVNKMLLGSFVQDYDDEDEEDQPQAPGTPLLQTTSPAEMSSNSSVPRSLMRDSTDQSISPPEPPVFISGPSP